MTQPQLIIKYCELYGSITPAKMANNEFYHNGVYIGFFGSDIARACRRLFKEKILEKGDDDRFTRFWLTKPLEAQISPNLTNHKHISSKQTDMFPEPKNWGNKY